MSFLSLRLPPARKAWKSLKSKIQSKLRRLNKSKAIKKHRNWPSASALVVGQRMKPYKKNKYNGYPFKKKAPEVAGTSSKEVGDDMWEALGLASPQMNGIDQRAEDFIRSFRAELLRQEMIARRL
ncbi:hypothetical protein Dsin_024867 [Dipteronia sinensis]|uniref:Uncharacterized protein n=1 Tax=Dipteronia sinensis TaxID=43782 RepID=A0AAD9ZV89_9ROSI|nr:hypothetical protein Dsin_024867 [Dipteronia sinensis]